LTPENRKETSFLKKRSKKLLLLWGMGFVAANAHDPDSKSLLVLFFRKEHS
jgi:hypothetical protein